MNLLRLLQPFWPWLWAGLALAAIPAVAQAWLPSRVVQPLFDQVLTGQFEQLPGLLGVAGGLLAVLALGGYALEAVMGYLSIRIPAHWRERVFERLLGSDLAAVPASSGGLAGRVVADLRELESFVFFGLGQVFHQGVALVVLLSQMLLHYTELTLYMLLVLPVMALLMGWVGRVVAIYSQRTQAALERMAARMSEGFARTELIQAQNLQSFAQRRLGHANRAQYRLGRYRALVAALNLPIGQLATAVLLGLLLALGVAQVQQKQLSIGDLTAFLTLLALCITPIQVLGRIGVLFAQGQGAALRVTELLDLPPAPSGGTLRPAQLEGGLELQNLSFAYGDAPVLHSLNLRIAAGSLVALVGASGSGKSSLLRLLLGLSQPKAGQVLLDGQPLSNYDLHWLRQRVAWVPQEPALFGATVGENLTALAPSSTPEQQLQALAQVGLGEVGLEDALGDDGSGLSVGQRQRLVIAAALLRQAKVLLLDEITSALDPVSEAQVMAAVEAVRPGRTVVLVAHRLSTVQYADWIVVMQQGRIVEQGPHAELLAQAGVYAQLWQR